VTAMLTVDQVCRVATVLDPEAAAIASVFAGRIADTGRDPVRVMRDALAVLSDRPQVRLLWASVREVLNIAQANDCGCHIVTVGHDILAKAIKLWGMDLEALSLDTVKMFAGDAEKAGYKL
jgi:transaldolase